MKWKIFIFVAVVSFAFSIQAQTTDPAAAAESRLREALRNSMLQVRSVQDELATLQAKQAQTETEKTALKGQLDALAAKMEEWAKKSIADKEASDKSIAALQTQVAGRDAEILRLNEALAKWKEGYNLAVNLAQVKEAERAKLAEFTIFLQRKVEDRETKNLVLFQLGNEILTRYQKYSLGDALAAKEPFTGIARARLETQVQDYQDKLVDQRIKQGSGAPPKPAPPAKP